MRAQRVGLSSVRSDDDGHRRTADGFGSNEHQPAICIRLENRRRVFDPARDFLPHLCSHPGVGLLARNHLALGQQQRFLSHAQEAEHIRAIQHPRAF